MELSLAKIPSVFVVFDFPPIRRQIELMKPSAVPPILLPLGSTMPYPVAPQLKPWLLIAAPETSTILAPPSTIRTAPVINDESSLARNTQTPAISSGSANRRRGKLADRIFATPS